MVYFSLWALSALVSMRMLSLLQSPLQNDLLLPDNVRWHVSVTLRPSVPVKTLACALTPHTAVGKTKCECRYLVFRRFSPVVATSLQLNKPHISNRTFDLILLFKHNIQMRQAENMSETLKEKWNTLSKINSPCTLNLSLKDEFTSLWYSPHLTTRRPERGGSSFSGWS